jgi:hypothetical protein
MERWWRTFYPLRIVIVLLLLAGTSIEAVRAQNIVTTPSRLVVSDNGHFLITEDGKPFFWLGDSAWEIFARLDRAQTVQYLDNRRDNGFNVIQAAILTEWSLDVPSAEGQVALIDNDPLKPNEAYFQHVDWVIEQAAERGLYVALIATWGDKVNLKNGIGPILFNTTNARPYGEYLGKRYANASNVIWLLGGDRNPEGDTELTIWREMGAGIEAGAGTTALITYHPRGGKSSAQWFQKDTLIDFNMIQSGHNVRDTPTWDLISEGFNRTPVKPILDAEINYEEFAIARRPANGYFTEYDSRKQAYRSVFAGGAGVTYGHQSMWQFYAPERRAIGYATTYWYDALNAPGAVEMRYLAQLMLSRPYLDRIPDQKLLLPIPNVPAPTNATQPIATRASDGSYAFIYLPSNQPLLIDFSRLSGTTIRAWWYDPRTGRNILIGEMAKSELRKLLPPVNDRDWILVLDDAGRGFGFPGRP